MDIKTIIHPIKHECDISRFAKPFDKVEHGTIYHKLRDREFLVRELDERRHDFLRSEVVNEATSNNMEIVSGVPQGTVFGPLLYIVALSVIPSKVQRIPVTSDADDTKF